jgi:hypothetical protein
MTREAILPLQSYRLARYAVPIPCYICEEENTFDAEYCSHCAAPMALAHQARSQKLHPRMIAVLGASAVGKTVYLGMLMDMLSRQPERAQLLARGAFSITLQQTTMACLAHCAFPQKTPNEPDRWNWVHCQIRRPKQKEPVELIVPDMAGEALLQEVDHPYTYRVITSYLAKCVGALVLVDALALKEGCRDQDYFTMKLVSYLAEINEDPNQGWARRPVALIFTKADQCEECLADPAGFAQTHASGLWQHCRERFGIHRFFAAGVAGACAVRESPREGRIQVPLRIEPYGIVEPFEWLLDQLYAQGWMTRKRRTVET